MIINNFLNDILTQIAKAADASMKPWRHSVVYTSSTKFDQTNFDERDLSFLIKCRDKEGKRYIEKDIELEIYRSGDEFNIILSFHSDLDLPILWHGKHSVWMDPNTGIRSIQPDNGLSLEAFARRLKSIFSLLENK